MIPHTHTHRKNSSCHATPFTFTTHTHTQIHTHSQLWANEAWEKEWGPCAAWNEARIIKYLSFCTNTCNTHTDWEEWHMTRVKGLPSYRLNYSSATYDREGDKNNNKMLFARTEKEVFRSNKSWPTQFSIRSVTVIPRFAGHVEPSPACILSL